MGEALALDTFSVGRTRGVRIISCRVAITPRGEGGLAGAVLANIPRGTEAIWIISIGITVTPLGHTGALDTLIISRARGIRIISCRVTVTPRGEWWLTRTV